MPIQIIVFITARDYSENIEETEHILKDSCIV